MRGLILGERGNVEYDFFYTKYVRIKIFSYQILMYSVRYGSQTSKYRKYALKVREIGVYFV